MFILNIVLFLFFVFCFSQWLVAHTMVHHLEDLPDDIELDSDDSESLDEDDCKCICSTKCCECDKEQEPKLEQELEPKLEIVTSCTCTKQKELFNSVLDDIKQKGEKSDKKND